jgi:hypothetical protein
MQSETDAREEKGGENAFAEDRDAGRVEAGLSERGDEGDLDEKPETKRGGLAGSGAGGEEDDAHSAEGRSDCVDRRERLHHGTVREGMCDEDTRGTAVVCCQEWEMGRVGNDEAKRFL